MIFDITRIFFCFSFKEFFTDDIMERFPTFEKFTAGLKKIELINTYPTAKITEEMYDRYLHWSEQDKLNTRAQHLRGWCVESGFTAHNISCMAVQDTARIHHVKWWFSYRILKDKLISTTVSMVKNPR